MSDRFVPSRWVRPAQLRAARAYLGLSCKDFSRIVGIGTATLNRYESAEGEQPIGSHAVSVAIADTLTSLGVRCIEVPAAENNKNGDGEATAASAAGGIIVDQAALDRSGKGDKAMKTFIAAASGSIIGAAVMFAGSHFGGAFTPSVETASVGVHIGAASNLVQASADDIVAISKTAYSQERKVEKPSDPALCKAITDRVVEVSKRLYTEGVPGDQMMYGMTSNVSGKRSNLYEVYAGLLESTEKLGCGFPTIRAVGLLAVDLNKVDQPTENRTGSEEECKMITEKAGEILREQVKHNPASTQAKRLEDLYGNIVSKARWCNTDRIIVQSSMTVDPSTVWGVRGIVTSADVTAPAPSEVKPD